MPTRNEIDRALESHATWKLRLLAAVQGEAPEAGAFAVARVAADDECAFGKWLHGDGISGELRASPHYREVVRIHAEFHEAAARVLDLALSGMKAGAEEALGPGGSFAALSAQLMARLEAWRRELPS